MLSCKLRPHHSLCIQFFEGKGYSDEFVGGMKEIVSSLNDSTKITLTRGCDVICESCPNKDDGSCDVRGTAESYDLKCLEIMEFQGAENMTWKELSKIAAEKIILSGRLSEVCGGCKWSQICLKKAEHMKSF